MTTKLEILWTPLPNKFITWGPEVCLYETQPLINNVTPSIKLSNTLGANLLATNTNHHYIKCLDVYPKSENDLLIAVGNTHGRIALSTFGPSAIYDKEGLTGKEFVPRHSRQCNALAWNPIDTNYIAVGLDKYRTDFALLVWDIMKYPIVNETSNRLSMGTLQPAVELAKPVAEFGASDTTHSLTWFNTSPKLLAVGMNSKNIKLLDFRDTSKVVNSTLTKAVSGLCVDPHNDRHLASFIENQIYIWDTRNFEKPILTLNHSKSLVKIAWSPTKYNLIASLQRDSSCISLFDIQHTLIGNEEIEPCALERNVVPGSPHNITSFSWHSLDENRFLTIALSGSIVDCTVFDRITLNWAPSANVVWTYGRKTMKCIIDDGLKDISSKMKSRAKADYGLKDEFYQNGDMVDDEKLTNVWNWLYLSEQLAGDSLTSTGQYKLSGVHAVLKLDSTSNKSEMVSILWSDLGNVNCHGSVRVFKHKDREKALRLCSWHFIERECSQLLKYLEQLEKEHAYTRAAALAVFNLNTKLAMEILSRSTDAKNQPILSVVAMALAGFTDDKSGIWKQYCATARPGLYDPYLRAIFAFLTAENYNYDNVLNENGMAVDDRVAFACIFLSDNKLYEYLKKLSEKLMEEGNLDGLLLTGNSTDGLKLLQRYLDGSGDIQTTALLAVKAFPNDINNEIVKDWIESYRNLLDTWQLWNERARFDIMLSSYHGHDKPAQQVYVSCNFCGKSISAFMQGHNRARGQFSRMGCTPNNTKMSSCPNCRKPLPRCAICLMHMGTTIGNSSLDLDNSRIVEFKNWFTWCQSCRHGGHASHMTQWFREHVECPVTACACKCISVDSVGSTILAL